VTAEKTFADLGVPARLIRVLTARGTTRPFPIQAETLPDTLAGRDVLGRGKTGSGKTLAFAIPLVSRLSDNKRRPSRPSGLVLAPTRELATQITATLEPLAAVYGLQVTTIFGGVPQSRQVSALRSGVDIVVACPGRLEDLIKQRLISLDAVEITVIDEADHMADLGFCQASPGSWPPHRPVASGCCSPRPSTTASTNLSTGSSGTRCCTRSMGSTRRCLQ
jgi:superfamily II DNA/RNA helicase